MVRSAIMAVAAGAVLAALTPATARADAGDFISPTGDVYCQMAVSDAGAGTVVCEGGGVNAAPRPECASHSAWGDRFLLVQGQAPVADCHNDTIRGDQAQAPVLDYDQSRTAGTITCDSKRYGVACTDSSTGHFFVMTADKNTSG